MIFSLPLWLDSVDVLGVLLRWMSSMCHYGNGFIKCETFSCVCGIIDKPLCQASFWFLAFVIQQ